MALIDENYLEQSITYLYKAYELDPTFYKALLKIGEVFFKQQKYDEALAYFNEILKADPNNDSALAKKGDILFMNNNIQEAMNLYQKALDNNENNEDALLGMGLCKHKMNELDEAINYYDKVLKVNDENANAMYNKAVALIAKGEKRGVNDLLKKAKKLDDSSYILYACGLNNLKDKKYDSANEMFDSCIQKDLKTPEVYLSKGQALYGNGEYEEALKYIDQAIQAKGEYYNAWNTRANTLDKLGKKDEALSWYKAAGDSKPDNALYLINYCVALLENGYNEQCKQLLAYVESIYQSQKNLFNEQEFAFIEKSIKNIHDKLDNVNKDAKFVRLDPSQSEVHEESKEN